MSTTASTLPSLSKPSPEDFLHASADYSRPVKITGQGEAWPAFREWTLASLASRYGDTPVKVFRLTPDLAARGDPDSGFDRLYTEMTVSEFASHMRHPAQSGRAFYWNQNLGEEPFRKLTEELVTPFPIAPGILPATYLWIGPQGCNSPLHYDLPDNVFCQLKGQKSIRLFSPEDSRYLSPHERDSKIFFVSRIDPLAPDLARFPEYRHATPLEVLMQPGEMLFIPALWWHHVTSVTDSISVNFWFRRGATGG